jgi:hypothetical protein
MADLMASVLPRRRIRALSRRLGVVQRQRKLDIVALVYSLVLGFSSGQRRTLTGLRRAYLRATGVRLAPSSFHARFDARLVELLRQLTTDALSRAQRSRPRLRGVFAPFVEVLAVDTALLRLHNALESDYPSVWTHYMKASAKLGVVMNVVGRGAKTVRVTHGSRHDVHLLQAGPWMKGRLLLFDLGFYRATLFQEIDRHGGYFLSRMKKDGNPRIVQAHRRGHRRLVGMKLKQAQARSSEHVLDVLAEMGYACRHPTPPLVTNHRVQFRCVALYDPERKTWHRYVTNLPIDKMKAEHFGAVYAARWEVELLFRELKSHLRIGHMPSANKHITEALIYAAVLALLVSRKLYHALRTRHRLDAVRLTLDRWAVLLSTVADELLALALRHGRRKRGQRYIERFLRAEATDPNASRLALPYRAQAGMIRKA